MVLAKSLLIGATIYALPAIYATLLAFRYRSAEYPVLMVRSFYKGQMNKFVLTAALFALALLFAQPLVVPALFVGFCLMIPAQIMAAMFISKNHLR